MKNNSVALEAHKIIHGPRRASYGPVEESFKKVALGWSVLFHTTVTPQQVALAMIWLKVCREANATHRDNAVDICGYADLLDQLNTKQKTQNKT